jgi:excisionase family DNA binding protein
LRSEENSQEVTNATIRHSGSYFAAGSDMAADSIEDDEILTASQVSKLLKLHQKTIYKLAEQDKIPGRQVGKVWRFLKSEIMKQFQKRDV